MVNTQKDQNNKANGDEWLCTLENPGLFLCKGHVAYELLGKAFFGV